MKYDTLADEKTLAKTVAALAEHGFEGIVVKNKAEALEKIKTLIPEDASVMNGSSVTLEEIGFVDYLKSGNHGWNNLHEAILKEEDKAKRALLRKQSVLSDFYLGSVHALAETGELVIASNTGSQMPHIVFTSQNLIFVVGTQKIVPDLDQALNRLEEYVVPLEDAHMQTLYKQGTTLSKIVIFKRQSPMIKRNIKVILVQEKLGF